MKNHTKYILCAIALLLVISLILDAFADGDHYRKRHRYHKQLIQIPACFGGNKR